MASVVLDVNARGSAEGEQVEVVPGWVWLTLLVYLSSYVFEGVVRWALSAVGLGGFIYLRDPLMMLALGRALFVFAGGVWVSYRSVLLWILFFLIIILSVWFGPRVPQVLFGAKILIPLVFGIVYGRSFFCDLHKWKMVFLTLCLATGVGVVGDRFIAYPWEGLSVDVAGAQVSIGRVWYSGEWQRLSGFARASYDAAIYAIVSYIFFSALSSNALARLAVFSIAVITVVLTTTKGIVLAFAVVGMCEVFRSKPWLWKKIITSTGSIFVLLGILLPALSLYVRPSLMFETEVERLLLYSFFDRMVNTWPGALSAIDSIEKFFFGAGIGSIGAAQAYFDVVNYNPADNAFVYVFVIMGMAGVLLLAYSVLHSLWVNDLFGNSIALRTIAVFVAVYGVTTNLFDNPVAAFCIGCMVGTALLPAFGQRLVTRG